MSNQDKFFDTEYLNDDLKNRSVRGGAVTFTGQGVKFFLQLGSTMVLARILTPRDFGLIAMVAAVTGFIMIFKDMGLSMATVQRAEINHDQISTLFWINIAISTILMLITIAFAPLVVWFYGEPRLMWVTIALAVAFIFGGLTVQHQALLRRQMRFTALVMIDILAMAVGVVAGVIFSLAGLGYWSLVLMQLFTPLSMAVGVWIAIGWRPGIPVRLSKVRSMLAFGGYLTGFSVVNYFARNIDKMLLGRYWGSHSVGLYTKAYSLLLLPISQITGPITAVAIPTLSRLQDEPDRFRNFYLKAIKLIAYISMPIVVAMGVLSHEIIGLILGKQWLEAGPIFMVLAVAAIWQPIGVTVGWIYISLGQTRRMFLWVCFAGPLIVLSFFIGLPWGAIGVATAYSVCITILIVPQFSFALMYSPIKLRDLLLNICHPFAASIMMGLSMIIIRVHLVGFEFIWVILGCLAIGGSVLLAVTFGLRSLRLDIGDIFDVAILAIRSN